MKAIWRKKDWSKSEYPERQSSYELFEELVDEFGVIATIEQFAVNPRCFYANVGHRSDQGLTRSGCLGSHDWARQWCESRDREQGELMSRHRIANRRAVETFAIEVEGQRYKISLGRELKCKLGPLENARLVSDQVGPVVEIFLNAQQVNSQADVLASDGAILMSLLLQYGHPIGEILASMKKNPDGSPSSPLGRAAALINEAGE